MYVITERDSNLVMNILPELKYYNDDYIILDSKNSIILTKKEDKLIYEVENIPAGVEPMNWSYTDKEGFIKLPPLISEKEQGQPDYREELTKEA